MTIEATSFNIGESPSVRLDLLSSDGLAPLPLPMPSDGQAERFCRFMGGDGERPMDIGRGLSALSSAVEATMVEVHVDATPAGESGQAVRRVVDAPVAETPVGESGQVVRRETVDAPQAPHMMPEDSGLTVPGPRSVPVLEQSVATNEAVPRVVDAPVAETPAGESGQAVRRETVDAPQDSRFTPKGIRLSPGVSRSAAAPETVVLQAAPAGVPVPAGVEAPVVPEAVQHVAAATARTEVIVETVNRMVETIVDRISVTPSFAGGEGEMRITLRPTVLDGSAINLSAKDGELSVAVVPATPQAAAVAAAALPRLESALAAHAPAFHHVAVVLASVRKGKTNEAA